MYSAEIEIHPGGPIHDLHDPFSQTNVLAKGSITQVLNAVNDFRFDILPSHLLYEADIRSYVSLVRVRDREDNIIFRGRVVDYTRKMSGDGQMTKSYVAECELAYLLDSRQEAEELISITLEDYFQRLLSTHNVRIQGEDKRIERININGMDAPVQGLNRNCSCGPTTDVYHINYTSTYQNIKDHVLGSLGGYIWLDYPDGQRRLNYADESGALRDMPIELAVNLENMTSAYQASQDYTRIIPLGRELERYELAINRLRDVGILNDNSGDILSTQFWLDEVQYWRDGAGSQHQEGEEGEGISPWTGQLLLGLSKLNYKNRCVCLDQCQNDSCSICNIVNMRAAIDREEMPADINSRYYYYEAVDFLCNSGLIGSSEHWKEEDKANNIELRWLIRLAAASVSPESPRRGNHNSLDSAFHSITEGIRWPGGESPWINDWMNWVRPTPPPPPCGCEDCDCCDCCDCEPCECCECCECEDCDCCDCEAEDCCEKCCDCCDCELCEYCENALSDDDCEEDCDCAFCRCDCECDCPPCECDRCKKCCEYYCEYCCEDCEYCEEREPCSCVVEDSPELEGFAINKVRQRLLPDEDLSDLSPWTEQLIINLSRLNFSSRTEEDVAKFQLEIEETEEEERIPEYLKAIDSLSNAGVINSPNYWKQGHLKGDERLQRLIRLADKMADYEYPILKRPEEAVEYLKERELIAEHEYEFWLGQIQTPPEGTLSEDDHRISEWVPELLIQLALINFDRDPRKLRELLAPKPIAPIDDFGAYNEALDSLSNAGAIQSPDYWKEPGRRKEERLRWLIRLADLTIDHDEPQSSFPRPRLTIKVHENDDDWLPIIEGPNVPIIEGIITFDTNDPVELRQKALKWITDHKTVTNSVSISAVDLSLLDNVNYDDFRVGDRYQVINPLLGIYEEEGYPLIEKKIDVVNPIKSGLKFGDKQLMMSSSR